MRELPEKAVKKGVTPQKIRATPLIKATLRIRAYTSKKWINKGNTPNKGNAFAPNFLDLIKATLQIKATLWIFLT